MAGTIRYFFEHPPLQTSALCIRGIGIREVMPPVIINRPAGTGDILIMFFCDEVIIRSARGAKLHPPNSLMIWPRAASHYYGNPDKSWNHSWTHCDGAVIRRLLKQERIPLNTVIPNINSDMVEQYLLALHLELFHGNPPDALIIRNIMHNWFHEIRRQMRRRKYPGSVPPRLQEVHWQMETNFAEPMNLIRLARQAGLSVPHFSAEFKKYFGASPINWLNRLRLQHATYLLRDHNLRVVDVAEKTGYPDQYYFSRIFKKRFGMSPLAYRRSLC